MWTVNPSSPSPLTCKPTPSAICCRNTCFALQGFLCPPASACLSLVYLGPLLRVSIWPRCSTAGEVIATLTALLGNCYHRLLGLAVHNCIVGRWGDCSETLTYSLGRRCQAERSVCSMHRILEARISPGGNRGKWAQGLSWNWDPSTILSSHEWPGRLRSHLCWVFFICTSRILRDADIFLSCLMQIKWCGNMFNK